MRETGYSDQARQNQKIYIIPWTHHIPESSRLGDLDFGPGAYVDLNEEDLRWFDYWLKGIDTGIMDEPPIRIFVMGENVWRFEHEWPLARTVFTPLLLAQHRDEPIRSMAMAHSAPTLPGNRAAGPTTTMTPTIPSPRLGATTRPGL